MNIEFGLYHLFTEVPTLAEFAAAYSVAFISHFVFVVSSCWYNVRALAAKDLTLTSLTGAYIHRKYFLVFRYMYIRIISI